MNAKGRLTRLSVTNRRLALAAVLMTILMMVIMMGSESGAWAHETHDHLDHHEHNHGHEHNHDHMHEHNHEHNHDHDHQHNHDHEHHHNHDHNHDHQHNHNHEHIECSSDSNPADLKSESCSDGNRNAWMEAFAGTLLITFGGNAVILLFMRHEMSPGTLNVMLAFAAGALLGDVFLHLLPHAIEANEAANDGHGHHHHHDHDHDHGHSHGDGNEHEHEHDLSVGLAVLAGILAFFVMEKILRLAGRNGHNHSHAHGELKASTTKTKTDKKTDEIVPQEDLVFGIRPAAILNMTGDALHNFTDGMSIAAAFQSSQSLGFTVTLAMLLHEIPHEVGDFAVLVSQGFSKWGAFKAQFVSAVGALVGCWFGLVVSSSQPTFVLSFTAGGFVYISVCSILPSLVEDPSTTFTSIILQTSAMIAGIMMMVLIAQHEPH